MHNHPQLGHTLWCHTATLLLAAGSRYPDLKFVIAEHNGDKRAANDIMQWLNTMFAWSGSNAQASPSDFAIYDQIADDYGLL